MALKGNAVIGQSGGPTVVINQSVVGAVLESKNHGVIDHFYGALHGVRGILDQNFVDLSAESPDNLDRIAKTPSAALGSVRMKPTEEDCREIFRVLRAHDVRFFFYVGGNDSAETAHIVHTVAEADSYDLRVFHIPKTIDNDVGDSEFKLIDHTPGYGSTAKYWMHAVQNANQENLGSSPADPVLVLQAMGRRIGFIPAAARLADPNREMPLQIYLAESPCSLEQLADNVNDQLRRDGRCVVVISEGFDVGQRKDSFGHTQFSSSEITVAQRVVNYLNEQGLATRGSARGNVPGTDQRHSMAYASTVDLDEAYRAGQTAAHLAAAGDSGHMATLLRQPGEVYGVRYDKVPLADVANSERSFPASWIADSGCDVTDHFLRYAQPLVGEGMLSLPMVGGRQRLTQFEPRYANQVLEPYSPQADRH